MNKTAIIIGSTGLIGANLTNLLINDNRFEKITALVRKSLVSNHSKLTYLETDFIDFSKVESQIKGDCLFICIGSTMAKAGSKEVFSNIDYLLPLKIAEIAHKNNIETCVVVSSLGANAQSSNFYLQTKGRMENAIESLGFKNTIFMRPSLLLGSRKEFRAGELIGKFIFKIIAPLFIGPLKKYKGIEAMIVAKAMLNCSIKPEHKISIFESHQIEILAKE
jgi:uncharacterized protein YbjT (DUF2867 family)